ncbi:ankyrin repeat and MYND domain-containing protein 2 isoform X2 [Macrosteles quadrilineatus]|uniref:ankyrin repeat and MYND domain-containing protein 2 isoform X2 n=1 Tax=Macrosteles quadrilineatus TaxID=74068 RepID=UPI0023E0DECF|nr:ankyrin repeat and MYND domain-containing protein 2 isoform X2 [Macrosteles quadrilineatus]
MYFNQSLWCKGADVNSSRHEHGYSALHFAVLSGNADVCLLLLKAGAKSHATNSVGKTPSEMAAFVGNHLCVAVINNFIPQSEIDYFTVSHGLESVPKLSPFLASPVHKFAMQVNMHPIRIALNLQPDLVNHLDPLRTVLTQMSEREMRRKETNELMSFKMHYLSCVVAEVAKCRQAEREKPMDPVEAFARKVLKSVRGKEYVESFIRDLVREFPHRECTIFRQMVTILAKKDAPSALSVVSSMICPQLFPDNEKPSCATCGEESAVKKCSKCKNTQYCDRNCQRLHWFVHKKECERISTSSREEKEDN